MARTRPKAISKNRAKKAIPEAKFIIGSNKCSIHSLKYEYECETCKNSELCLKCFLEHDASHKMSKLKKAYSEINQEICEKLKSNIKNNTFIYNLYTYTLRDTRYYVLDLYDITEHKEYMNYYNIVQINGKPSFDKHMLFYDKIADEPATLLLQNMLYISGGRIYGWGPLGSRCDNSAAFCKIDITDCKHWAVSLSGMNYSHYGHKLFYCCGYIYALGWNEESSYRGISEKYDIAKNKWLMLPSIDEDFDNEGKAYYSDSGPDSYSDSNSSSENENEKQKFPEFGIGFIFNNREIYIVSEDIYVLDIHEEEDGWKIYKFSEIIREEIFDSRIYMGIQSSNMNISLFNYREHLKFKLKNDKLASMSKENFCIENFNFFESYESVDYLIKGRNLFIYERNFDGNLKLIHYNLFNGNIKALIM